MRKRRGKRRGKRRIDSPGGSEPVARRRFSSVVRHGGVSEKFVPTHIGMATGLGGATGGRGQILWQFQSRMAGMEEERPPARGIVLWDVHERYECWSYPFIKKRRLDVKKTLAFIDLLQLLQKVELKKWVVVRRVFFRSPAEERKKNGLVNSFSFPPFPKGQVQKKYRNLPPFLSRNFYMKGMRTRSPAHKTGNQRDQQNWLTIS